MMIFRILKHTKLILKISKEAKDILKKFDELTGDSLTAAERMMDSKDKDPGGDNPGGKKKKSFWK